jgi:hypothetical protein
VDLHQGEQFLLALGADSITQGGDWLRCSCPLAAWRHAGGSDSNPSFGLRIDVQSRVNCFACGFHGDVKDLLIEIRYWVQSTGVPAGMDLALATSIAYEEVEQGYIQQQSWSLSKLFEQPRPWPEKWISSFFYADLVSEASEYLSARGVTNAVSRSFGLRWDPKRHAILFPLRSHAGQLVGARGRLLQGSPKYLDYKYQGHSNAKFCLYNLERISYLKPLVITEGTFDCLSVARVYPNVVSTLGVALSKQRLSLLKNAPEIWCFFDDDKAGRDAEIRVKESLKTSVVRRVPYKVAAKDPGEMTKEQIHECLQGTGVLT